MEKDNEIICDVTSEATDSLNSTKQYGLGIRHIQLALLFMCMASVYVTRVNLSMAIVGMTEMEETDGSIPKFDWGEQTKGMILSSFFWGYLVMNIPAAILTHNFNNKILLSVVMTGNCVLTLLTPVIVTKFDYVALVVTRVVQGLLQGFLMPNMHSLMSKWVPPNERSRAGAFVIGGMNFGITLTMFSSGYILSSSIGWPLIYYMSGGLCVCWLILFITLSANSPDLHKSISDEERDYIKYALEHRVDDHVKLSIPWKAIFTSKPVWAIVFAHMGQNWGMWTLLTEIPTFFKSALNYNIKSDGELSALPYFLMWIASFPLAFLADQLIRKKYMTLEVSRKFWNNIGQTLNGLFLIAFPFIAQNVSKEAAIVVYTIATTLNCCMLFGFNINHIDISPNFSAILMGISNCAANITSILGPLYAGFVVKDEKSISDWRSVFFMSAACYIIGSLIFTAFGSGKVQAWNNPTKISTSRRNSYFPEQLDEEIKPDMTSVFHSKSTNIGMDVKTRY